MVSSCLDGRAMLRVGNTGDWIGTFVGHKGCVWSAALSAQGTFCLTGSADFTAALWSATTGERLMSFSHNHIVRSVDLDASARRGLSGGRKNILRLFDLDHSGNEMTVAWQVNDALPGPIRRVLFSPLDPSLIVAAGATSVAVWDVRQQTPVHQVECTDDVKDIVYCGNTLVVAHGSSVSFCDATLAITKTHTYPFAVNSAALHPAGKRFVCGGSNFGALVCDVESGDALEAHGGHHGPVHCLRYAPDAETFASSSEDGTIRLWQTSVKNYGLWVVNDDENSATN